MVSNLPTMSTHDLHNECPLVGVCGAHNGINSLDDAVQGRISAYCHVSATEVIVNWPHLKMVEYHYNLSAIIIVCNVT